MTVIAPAIVVQAQAGHLEGQKLHKRVGGGNGGQLIAFKLETLQRPQAPKGVRLQVDQTIWTEVEHHQAAQAEEGGRSHLAQAISGQGKAAQWGRLCQRLARNGSEWVVAQIKLDQVGQFDEGLGADVTCKNFKIKKN